MSIVRRFPQDLLPPGRKLRCEKGSDLEGSRTSMDVVAIYLMLFVVSLPFQAWALQTDAIKACQSVIQLT